MPRELEIYLDYLDKVFLDEMNEEAVEQYGFKALVKSAKKAGIRVVAIDNDYIYRTLLKSETRYKEMNAWACKIINREAEEKNMKWVALMGKGHVSNCLDALYAVNVRTAGGVQDNVGGVNLVHYVQFPPVPDLLKLTANQSLVFFYRHDNPP